MLEALSQLVVEIGRILLAQRFWQARRLGPRTEAARSRKGADRQRLSFGDFHMLSIFRRLMKNEKGATAIEYTLIASLIAVAAIVAMTAVGGKVNGVLSNAANSMN